MRSTDVLSTALKLAAAPVTVPLMIAAWLIGFWIGAARDAFVRGWRES